VRRDGRQGVGASYSTDEAGELARQDPVEGRGRRIADRLRGTMPDIPGSETISTRQQTIATRARQAPKLSFTSLNHYIDLAWLHEACRRTRKDGAPGVDGQTAAAYAEHLEDNLRDLLDRAKSGRYRAPAVKRAYLPKGDGSTTRPIGVPTFEDKILQRAVVMVARANLRARLSGLLVRVSTRSVGAPGAAGLARPAHANWGRVDYRTGRRAVFGTIVTMPPWC